MNESCLDESGRDVERRDVVALLAGTGRRLRLAVCATHPVQYQAPLWRELSGRPELELRVFYGCNLGVRTYVDDEFGVAVKWDTPLLAGYGYEILDEGSGVRGIGFLKPSGKGIGERLRAFDPDWVLVTAYSRCFDLRSLIAGRRSGARILIRHEASDVASARSVVKGRIRDFFLRRLYSRIDRFAVIGVEARRHLLRLGVDPARLWEAPYCVDTKFVETQVDIWGASRARLRAEAGVADGGTVFVFSGKLVEKKNPLMILDAIGMLPADMRRTLHLVVAGDGALKAEMERRGRAVLGSRLHLAGFLNQTEIGRAYAMADALILPSRRGAGETWGLVVNEAMQYGLPAFVSDGVGAGPDLVEEGRTGFCFEGDDPCSMAEAMSSYFRMPTDVRVAMGRAARIRVQRYSLRTAGDGICRAISGVFKERRQR